MGKEQDIILQVPYHSQLLEIANTIEAVQACSVTCIKMVLDFYKTESSFLTVEVLSSKGKGEAGFSQNGWLRDYVENFLKDEDLLVDRDDKMALEAGLQKLVAWLDSGNPVLLSVKRLFCEQEYFHMVVAVGYRKDESGRLVGLYYHEPYATSIEKGQNKYLQIKSEKSDLCNFENYWRKMAIFVSKK